MRNPYLKTQVICAGPLCHCTKGEGNHWFLVVPRSGVKLESMVTICGIVPLYYVLPYDEELLSIAHALPVCGEACLGKLQSELLQTGRK